MVLPAGQPIATTNIEYWSLPLLATDYVRSSLTLATKAGHCRHITGWPVAGVWLRLLVLAALPYGVISQLLVIKTRPGHITTSLTLDIDTTQWVTPGHWY